MDGTYNNDIRKKELLNISFFDVTNKVPVEIKSWGKGSKNQEIKYTTKYIKYTTKYIKNNIKFIIRARGNTKNTLMQKLWIYIYI